MKRLTATVLFITAISAPALAESPAQRELHSWDYVEKTATSATTPQPEAPVSEHHEQRPYYHHEAGSHEGAHHHGKHHEGKKHHGGKHGHAHHHHHHHHKDAAKTTAPKASDKPAEQPKQ